MYKTGKLSKEWLKSKHYPFLKKIPRVTMRNLTFEMILQNKHYSFYALVMPN